MSAFHPITTEQRTQFYVGSVPIGDTPRLPAACTLLAAIAMKR